MNSSSEQLQSPPYVPLEYHEAADSSQGQRTKQCADDSGQRRPASQPSEQSPDAGALLAIRVEEARRTITAQAHQEADREIQRVRAEIACAIEQFAQQREDYFHQAEAEVVSLVLAIARRLIHRETQIDPRLLTGLVDYELEQLDRTTSVRLLVSPESLTDWREKAPAMSRAVEVVADKALANGELRIETALGSTMVSFEHELKEIERGFFDLLSCRPVAMESKPVRLQ